MKHIMDPNGSDAMRESKYAVSCIATGRSTDPEGFFDASKDVVPGSRPVKVVLSAAVVKECARQLGWASPAEIEELTAQIEENTRVIQEREARIAEIEGVREHITSLERSLHAFAAPIDPEPEKAAA